MKLTHRIKAAGIAALAGLAVSTTAQSIPFSFEARTLGMGNARVATADIAVAPFANPAMLAHQPVREDFALLLSVGGFINDNDGMVDLIDQFQTVYDAWDAGGQVDDALAVQAVSLAQQMENKVIAPEVTGMFSIGVAGEVWSFALSARSDAIAAGNVTNLAQDKNDLTDPTKNILNLEGVMATEVGVSFARNFEFMDRKLSIGLKPKIVNLQSLYYSESITTSDAGIGDIRDEVIDLENYLTLDAGVTLSVTNNFILGLVANNLVAHEVNFTSRSGTPLKMNFDHQLRLGAAYRTDFFTLGADIDLIENEPLLVNNAFKALKSQNVSLGAELNAWDFMQLRLGLQKNLSSGISSEAKANMYTAGVGLWLGFNLDLAVVKQNESLGAMLQTGFRF